MRNDDYSLLLLLGATAGRVAIESTQGVDLIAELVVGGVRGHVADAAIGADEADRGRVGLPGLDSGCRGDLVRGRPLDVDGYRDREPARRL
jgi:hypothetical protein